jgi:hypothetical protein
MDILINNEFISLNKEIISIDNKLILFNDKLISLNNKLILQNSNTELVNEDSDIESHNNTELVNNNIESLNSDIESLNSNIESHNNNNDLLNDNSDIINKLKKYEEELIILYVYEQLYYYIKLLINKCIKKSNYYNKPVKRGYDYDRHLYEKYKMNYINDIDLTKNYLLIERNKQLKQIEIDKNEIINNIINISESYNITNIYERIKQKTKMRTLFQLLPLKNNEKICDFLPRTCGLKIFTIILNLLLNIQETLYDKNKKYCSNDNYQVLEPYKINIKYLQDCLLNNNFNIIKINYKFTASIEKIILDGFINCYTNLLDIYKSIMKNNKNK